VFRRVFLTLVEALRDHCTLLLLLQLRVFRAGLL